MTCCNSANSWFILGSLLRLLHDAIANDMLAIPTPKFTTVFLTNPS